MGGPFDAVVVGAGPAGCATATLLARQGASVLLVDKSVAPAHKVCGEYLSPGCLPILDRLGALEAVREAARPLHGMRIHSLAGRILDATYPPGPERLHGLSIPRRVLDPLLLDHANKAGATVETGFLISDVVYQGDRIVGVRGRVRGQWTERRAGIIVGADGRSSTIAARLGGRRPHPKLDRMAWMVYLHGVVREDTLGEIFLGPNCYGILNPVAPGVTNLGFVAPRGPVPPHSDRSRWLRTYVDCIPRLADRIRHADIIGEVRCLAPLAFRAVRLTAPGALLVGDAAGFLDPFTGEGIFAGLRSAELAAQAAADFGGRHDRTLAPYAEAWAAEFEPKWRLIQALQAAIARPWLSELFVALLAHRPTAATTLMAAAGDLTRPQDLRPIRLLLRMVLGRAAKGAASSGRHS